MNAELNGYPVKDEKGLDAPEFAGDRKQEKCDETTVDVLIQQNKSHLKHMNNTLYEGGGNKTDVPLAASSLLVQVAVTCAVSLFFVSAGVAFGYTGIILPSVTDPNSDDIYMNTEQVSLFTGALVIGCIIGSLIGGPITIKFGQRWTLMLIIPVVVIGWLLPFFTKIFGVLLFSRILIGVFNVLTCGASGNYVAETVHSSIRGRMFGITDLCRQIGFLLVFIVGSTSLNWRAVGLVCCLSPLVIPCLVLLVVPDSPRWLAVSQKGETNILKSLRFFRGRHHNIQAEYKGIVEDVNNSKESTTAWDQIKQLKDRSILKRFILLVYLNFASNFTGNFVVVSYSVVIFESANTEISPYLSTILCGVARVVGSVVYILVADRFGRRPIIIIFLSLSAVSTFCLGIFFHLKYLNVDTSSINWVPLACLLLYTLFTSLSHPGIMLLRSELLPNSFRSLGVNLIFFALYFGSLIVAISYPFMAESIGIDWTFWTYSINTAKMVVIIFFFLPETKGKSLEEIAKLY